MQELNPKVLGKNEEIISLKCELHKNLQKVFQKFKVLLDDTVIYLNIHH